MISDARTALAVLRDGGEGWVRLMPEVIEDLLEHKHNLLDLVEEFESYENEAGIAAVDWLRTKARAWHGTTMTWLYLRDGRLDAFYASASTTVLLSQKDTERLRGRRDEGVWIPRRQPATLIAWIARRPDASDAGVAAVRHALSSAVRVGELQGNLALVLDPFDEETANMWLDWPHLDFRRSSVDRAEGDEGRPRRLWTPLRPPEPTGRTSS